MCSCSIGGMEEEVDRCLHSILVFTSSSNGCKTYCWNCRTVITYLSVLHGDIDIVLCPMHACRMGWTSITKCQCFVESAHIYAYIFPFIVLLLCCWH